MRIRLFLLALAAWCCALGPIEMNGLAETPLTQRGTVHFVPTAAEPEIAERFQLKEHEFDWQAVQLHDVSDHLEVWEVRFPSPVVTPHAANNTVHCEYFQPRCPGKRPAVIVLHILGGDFPLSRLFCNALAQHGVAALFVKLPYYGPRREPGVSRKMVSPDPRETLEGMTQAMLDIRRATAWLAARPEVDDQQLGIFGISLGGITSSLAAGVEPRIQNVCTLLAGGDISQVAWEHRELRDVREKWLATGGTKDQFFETLLPIDPVTHAAGARGKRILMLNAAEDELIPRACTVSLWKALGEPEIQYYSGGHYSVIRHIITALDRVSNFFATAEGMAEVCAIGRAKEPITIDGKLDEDVWRTTEPVLANRPHGRSGQVADQPPLTARFAWDDDYLYVGYEVRDTDLVAIGTGRQIGPPGNQREASAEYLPEKNLDLVEFFVSLGSPTEFWELHHSAGNHLNTHWCTVPTAAELRKRVKPQLADVKCDRERFIADDGQRTVARAVRLLPKEDGQPSTVNDSSDTDAGYVGELRLPWAGLELPASRRRPSGGYRLDGLELQILAAALNGNGGDARYWSSGELPKQMFHFSSGRWPKYRLE
jgi:dienelactone hydrolase